MREILHCIMCSLAGLRFYCCIICDCRHHIQQVPTYLVGIAHAHLVIFDGFMYVCCYWTLMQRCIKLESVVLFSSHNVDDDGAELADTVWLFDLVCHRKKGCYMRERARCVSCLNHADRVLSLVLSGSTYISGNMYSFVWFSLLL